LAGSCKPHFGAGSHPFDFEEGFMTVFADIHGSGPSANRRPPINYVVRWRDFGETVYVDTVSSIPPTPTKVGTCR
jgi:hypothetical protein